MGSPQSVEQLVTKAEAKGHPSFVGDVWKALSRIDCTDFIEKKGSGSYQLSYLSWAHAWGTLMEWFPESDYAFDEPHTFPDGTQEVWVTVWVKQGENVSERRMWLPVMNHQNKPIINPNAFQVNTTRMRCLTKCLALFGLGHYIYAGEDIPRKENDEEAVGELPKNSTGRKPQSVAQTLSDEMGIEVTPEHEEILNYVGAYLAAGEKDKLLETWDGIDADTKAVIYPMLSREEQKLFRQIAPEKFGKRK